MGLASMPWEESFAAWLIEYPPPERHPASMEFEYIELLGRILKANHNNSKT
jgi:hypothetical protein